MHEKTLVQIVENFYRLGSEIAYVQRRGYRIQRWSYRQVAEAAFGFAQELGRRGIGPGDKILLWGEDSAEWVVAFFGCILRGAVVVPLDRFAAQEFANRVRDQVDARLSVCSRSHPPIDSSIPRLVLEDLRNIVGPHPVAPPPWPGVADQGIVEIVFTSGTTTDPKGVVLSSENILSNLRPLEIEIAKYLKLERIVHPLRFLNLLPLSHVFGQFMGIFIPQIMGSTVLFHDTFNPSEIIRTVKRERISILASVPRVLESLKEKVEGSLGSEGMSVWFKREFEAAEAERFFKRWWRFRKIHRQFGWKFWAFISGGASLSQETEQFWERLGFAVVQGYGLTETASLISVNNPLKLRRGSVGKILPGREVRLSPGGEILVRGGSIAKSYYQGRELKSVADEDNWFHTGDLGVLDPDGNLYFRGRRKNVIVSPEGMKIYPEDLEAALRRQPEIRDCVVLGVQRGGNEEACAVVIFHDKAQNPVPVIQRANAFLSPFQHVRRWVVWPDADFPRTSTQKPRLERIREYVHAQLQQSPTDTGQGGIIAGLIRHITARRLENLSPKSNLTTDLDLDSIERVQLLSALEDRFQVELDESQFASAKTVGELENMLRRPPPRVSFSYPRWAQRRAVALFRTLIYYLLVWPLTVAMSCPRVRGRENLKGLNGPLLFAANHVTQVDVAFILAALPFRLRHRLAVAMLGEMLEQMLHPPSGMTILERGLKRVCYGLLVAFFNVFPLPQKAGFRSSLAFAGESVDRGYSILVFPEGTRTRDGNLGPFRAGIGLMATNLDVPVVPIRIDGLYELKKGRKLLSRPGTVTVTIGTALRFDPGADPFEVTRHIEIQMRALQWQKE